jgi:hypothetical protein
VNFNSSHRTVLQSILSGSYTPYDVREFVRLCHTLAHPLIRKRILQGRINLESLGLRQIDLVYDCIADLFVRDSAGHFTEVEKFFEKEIGDTSNCSDVLIGDTLRRIVFSKVHVNLIRIHCGIDPAFGKILHNMDVALSRSRLFEKYVRFGETTLACCETDLLLHLPTPPLEYVRAELSRVVLIHDSVPTMLKKLRDILVAQQEFQRTVSYVSVAVLLKEVYALGVETDLEPEPSPLTSLEEEDALRWVQEVCADLRGALRSNYVEKGKMTEEMFEMYLQSASEILTDLVSNGSSGQRPFFEYLNGRMPQLTKEQYISRHKSVLEYMVRLGKERLAEKVKSEESAR